MYFNRYLKKEIEKCYILNLECSISAGKKLVILKLIY